MITPRYDLAVIGSGRGAFAAAIAARNKGRTRHLLWWAHPPAPAPGPDRFATDRARAGSATGRAALALRRGNHDAHPRRQREDK
jgi:hypothetical protein